MAVTGRKSLFANACLLWLALGSMSAFGQGFEQLEARLKDHPALAAVRLQSEAFREDATVLTAWPDPVVSVGVNNFPLFDPSFKAYLPTNRAIGVSQQIPSSSQRRARSEQALRRAAHSAATEAFQFAQMRAELIVALVEKRRIAEQVALLRKQDSLYGELLQIVQSEIAAGRPELFRLAEIDLERAGIARALAELEGETGEANARLVDLVGEPAAVSPPPLEPLDWTGAPDAFHLVRMAQAQIAVADAEVMRAEAAWKPDWGLQLTYQQRDSGSGDTRFAGDDWVSAAVTFSVPLWGKRSQAPALRSARARREGAVSRHMAAARSAAARFAALKAAQGAAESAIVALETQIAAIDDQLRAQRTKYESGIGDYSPVIDGELAELSLRIRIVEEQARRDRAVARLNALMVTP